MLLFKKDWVLGGGMPPSHPWIQAAGSANMPRFGPLAGDVRETSDAEGDKSSYGLLLRFLKVVSPETCFLYSKN